MSMANPDSSNNHLTPMAKKANLARAVAPPLNASHLANALRTFAPSAKRNKSLNTV